MVVAVLSAVVLVASGSALLGALVCVTYVLAGMGVREGSVGAAVTIFLCYLCDRVVAVEGAMIGFGAGSPLVGLFAQALLLSNIRGTILSRKWQGGVSKGTEADEVERPTSSIGEKLSNVMPAAVWPKGQYVFFPMAGALLLLTVVVMVRLPAVQRQRAAARQQQERQHMEMRLPVR